MVAQGPDQGAPMVPSSTVGSLAAPLTELECCHVMTRRARQGCQRVATVDIYRCRYCHGVTTVFLRRQLGEPKRGRTWLHKNHVARGLGLLHQP